MKNIYKGIRIRGDGQHNEKLLLVFAFKQIHIPAWHYRSMPEIRSHRHKELHWHHIDFTKGEIMLWVGKQGSAARRKRAPLHPEVVKIFKKWKEVNKLGRTIPHSYIWIWKRMKEVKQITGLNFANHDLRRLKAQLTEKKTHDATATAYAIGDKSVEMVKSHYAPTSMSTLRHLNDEAFAQLTTELEGNA